MKKIWKLMASVACVAMIACSNENLEIAGQESSREMVNLVTRAESNGSASGQVGIFMVYGAMQSTGNYLNNLCLTNNGSGSWSSEQPIFWQDNTTHADFYAYSPYNADLTNTLSHTFQVSADQSTKADQEASDFLWGKLADQEPTDKVLNLMLRHIFSRAIVRVAPGEGFTEDELKNGTLGVRINGIRTQATINLAEGNAIAEGNPQTIIPLQENELTYSAIVVPQQVSETGLITVRWNGTDYTLTSGMTFAAGKQYTFTITLKKTSGGINIGISGWEDAGEDYGGTVN